MQYIGLSYGAVVQVSLRHLSGIMRLITRATRLQKSTTKRSAKGREKGTVSLNAFCNISNLD